VGDDLDDRIAGVASLAEPLRGALYRVVASSDDAVSRSEAASALGVPRSVAAFHLDRLVADGLLTVEFRRLTGRQGPGAGRPAKLYRRAAGELSVTLPPRRYDVAAQLLAAAVAASRDGTPIDDALRSQADTRGRALGEMACRRAGSRSSRRALHDAVLSVLEEFGYEPRPRHDEVVLFNCPFHALVGEQRDLVCGVNHDLLAGMAAAVGDEMMSARLQPDDGVCCVRIGLGGRER
jgi:predicted ArsR family transcriptional regulator